MRQYRAAEPSFSVDHYKTITYKIQYHLLGNKIKAAITIEFRNLQNFSHLMQESIYYFIFFDFVE